MSKPVCVIVGVGPGNGAAFARKFTANGYRVALLARNERSFQDLQQTLEDAQGYVCNAADAQSVTETFNRIAEQLGPVEVLIYNASTRDFASIDETTPEEFEEAWRVTTFGCLLAIQQVLPAMRSAKHGSIVMIGATASWKGSAGFVSFSAAKAAQRSLAQSVARHVGPEGIHVSYVIVDGLIDLPPVREALSDQPEEFFMRAEDIAESVFFLTTQPRSAWTFELDVRPFGEVW
ncbi:MAG: SDR family NAD(P)-dependent oxidoreductase [Candidatus Competibacteraceae bacterium]|jgi:NAD(P)-dependent dehydrogenase (short-subunit alcohol dehydrogenase family)|nr:SDR family NAD(P)-dependent oxidoreductase [Candidatus Competibacteraceae bacterium]